jgi:hypothetical protein
LAVKFNPMSTAPRDREIWLLLDGGAVSPGHWKGTCWSYWTEIDNDTTDDACGADTPVGWLATQAEVYAAVAGGRPMEEAEAGAEIWLIKLVGALEEAFFSCVRVHVYGFKDKKTFIAAPAKAHIRCFDGKQIIPGLGAKWLPWPPL